MKLHALTAALPPEQGGALFLKEASLEMPRSKINLRGEEKDKNGFVDILLRRLPLKAGRIEGQPLTSFPLGRQRPFLYAVSGKTMIKHLTHLYGGTYAQNLSLFSTLLSDKTILNSRLDYASLPARQEFSLIAGLIGTFELYILEALPETVNKAFAARYWPYLNFRLKGKTLICNMREKAFLKAFCSHELSIEKQKLILSL